MKIFIHQDSLYGDKWHERYHHLLSQRYGLKTVVVDFLKVPLDEICGLVARGDGLIGRWGHADGDFGTFSTLVDAVWTLFGGRVFPAPHTYLYYNDKARQASLFANRGYPTPATAFVHSISELEAFINREQLDLPIVIKDKRGTQSRNVRLLLRMADATFPCIAQQFCPGNSHDYRVCVIGHRVMGFARLNRKNDFRASGSHNIIHAERLECDIVQLASRISVDNRFESMAYDIIRLGHKCVVLEMSYTYPHWSLRDCQSYYDTRLGCYVSKDGVYPEDFIVEDFISSYYPDLIRRQFREHTLPL